MMLNVELGMEVDVLNVRLRTPLHDAACMGQTHTVEALLKARASVRLRVREKACV